MNKTKLKETIKLFEEGYGFQVKEINFYQLRISHEEHNEVFFDWYFTTGSLVRTKKDDKPGFYGKHKSLGKIQDPEEVAIIIKEFFNQYD